MNSTFLSLLLFFCCLQFTVLAEKKSPHKDTIHLRRRFQKLPRILQGETAKPHEFPFMAMVTFDDGWFFCGAVVIDSQWVLTGAQCVDALEPEEILVRVGSHNISVHTEEEQIRSVQSIHIHEKYIPWNLTNDIALLRLSSPLVFTKEVGQICLFNDPNDDFAREALVTMGWGTINGEYYVGSDVLQKINEVGVNFNDCVQFMKTVQLDHALYLGSLCSWSGGLGRGSCSGDAGGPLVWRDWYDMWRLAGITSWGFCGKQELPSVYSKIGYFLPWIIKTAEEARLC